MKYLITPLFLCLALAGSAQKTYSIDADKKKLNELLYTIYAQDHSFNFLTVDIDDHMMLPVTLHLKNVTLLELLVKILAQSTSAVVGYLDPWTPNCLSFRLYVQGDPAPGEIRGKKY